MRQSALGALALGLLAAVTVPVAALVLSFVSLGVSVATLVIVRRHLAPIVGTIEEQADEIAVLPAVSDDA